MQKPKTIILIGPNHYEKGDFKFLSSLYSWNTPFGKIEPDLIIINKLLKENQIRIDEKVLPNDHSITGLLPSIKYYLPNVKIVPILISASVKQSDANIFAEKLKTFLSKDVIIIAAVDFSHYLNNNQAKEKDKITLETMNKFDYEHLFALNNNFVDSPASIAIFLMTMQKFGTTKYEVLYNTNSGELLQNNFSEVTSYFSIVYY